MELNRNRIKNLVFLVAMMAAPMAGAADPRHDTKESEAQVNQALQDTRPVVNNEGQRATGAFTMTCVDSDGVRYTQNEAGFPECIKKKQGKK